MCWDVACFSVVWQSCLNDNWQIIWLHFSKVCVRPPPSAVSMTLPAFAAECCAVAPLLLSPITCSTHTCCCWYLLCSAANLLHAAAAVSRWDRWTDGWTIDSALYTMRAVSTSHSFSNSTVIKMMFIITDVCGQCNLLMKEGFVYRSNYAFVFCKQFK